MAAISISKPSLNAIKRALRADFIDEKSSHLSEALAYSLGFTCNAALLTAVTHYANDPPIQILDTERFVSRLEKFGYQRDDEFDFESNAGLIIKTNHYSASGIEYKTVRQRAWRNLMVCAINEGIERKIFSLIPGDNRWDDTVSNNPEDKNPHNKDNGFFYDFKLQNDMPARGYVIALGWGGELAIRTAVLPKGYSLDSSFAGFSAGEAVACSWLEREKGAWLQTALKSFHCRKSLLEPLAALNIQPLGYGDKGGVM